MTSDSDAAQANHRSCNRASASDFRYRRITPLTARKTGAIAMKMPSVAVSPRTGPRVVGIGQGFSTSGTRTSPWPKANEHAADERAPGSEPQDPRLERRYSASTEPDDQRRDQVCPERRRQHGAEPRQDRAGSRVAGRAELELGEAPVDLGYRGDDAEREEQAADRMLRASDPENQANRDEGADEGRVSDPGPDDLLYGARRTDALRAE